MSTLNGFSAEDKKFWEYLTANQNAKDQAKELLQATPTGKRFMLLEKFGLKEVESTVIQLITAITKDPLEQAYLNKKVWGSGLTMLPQNLTNEQLHALQEPTGLSEAEQAAFEELIDPKRRRELDFLFKHVQSARETRGNVQKMELGESLKIETPKKVNLEEIVQQARASYRQLFPE